MKSSLLTAVALFTGVSMLFAAEQTATLKVSGSCGSCKKRIEKAAKSVNGVQNADWDKKTKVFTAVYDDTKASVPAITNAILEAGYDVDTTTASDDTYNKLPDCCKYRK